MWDIVRSVFYTCRKRSLMKIIFVLMLLCSCSQLITFSFYALGYEGPTAGEFSATYIPLINTFAQIFLIMNTCYICTMDFGDKTANCELVTGHTRFEVYSARIIASLILSISGFLLCFIVPAAAASIMWGWGSCIYLGEMIFRWLILIIPAARIALETAALSFIIRKPSAVFITTFMAYTCLNAGINFAETSGANCILGITNLNELCNIDFWSTYGLNKVWITFDAAVSPSFIAATIIISVISSVLFFFIGYTFFRYDDID